MPTALRVNPTRMEMTRIKKRLVTATRGHKLLKDKRDEMVRQFILLIRENYTLRREVEAELSGALRDFAMARAVMSPQSLEAAVLYPARQAELHVSERNILSVHVPTIEADQASLETTVQSYGFAETSAELDGSIATLASVLPKLVRLAEIEKTCDMLADEIEKTRRRVNALEYVMIPQFEMTIREISMKLEENERGATTRLMKVKDIIPTGTFRCITGKFPFCLRKKRFRVMMGRNIVREREQGCLILWRRCWTAGFITSSCWMAQSADWTQNSR